MVTQNEIAKMAGVSRATVERVLRNQGYVKEDTRLRVMDIVNRMNYRPNRAGQMLTIPQKKLTIGCIIIKADNPFYQELNCGIQQKAEEFQSYGIEVVVESVEFRADKQIRAIERLMAMNVNALVIQPASEPTMVEALTKVERANIPIVMVNTDLRDFVSTFCYVGNDFYLCGKTAANLMDISTGGKCAIGIITGFFNAKSHADRIDGFQHYLADRPGMVVAAVAENHDDEMESYYETMKMLADHPEIDAVFLVAGGVYGAGKAIRKIRQDENREIKVISFDDVPTTKDLVRDGVILATICQQPIRQGRMALSVLFNYLLDGKMPDSNRLYTDIQIKLKANIDA